MNPLFIYLLQAIAASGLLYGFYHFVLRNNKFHHYNRFYLLISLILAITIPFLNIPIYFSVTETDTSLLQQFSILISTDYSSEEAVIIRSHVTNWFSFENVVYVFYFLIAFVAFLRILFSLNKIRTIARNNPVEKLDKINFVNTTESNAPFSFFNWLFWNRRIELHSEKGEQIFRHELFHIQQKHSWDIIFIEIFTVIFWINPFFHLMKKELKAIHEFLADEFAVKENKKWEYAELLLMQAFDTQINLVNPFFHNQIKRRIAMLNLSSKPGHQYIRKLMVLPVLALVLFLFAFSYKNNGSVARVANTLTMVLDAGHGGIDQDVRTTTGNYTKNNGSVTKATKPFTLVLDAGHGGDDTGAKSSDGSYSEANLSLEISKTIQRLAPEYNINVTMTRENEDDPYVELKKRVEIINNTKPDAFVSIHVNLSSSKTETKLSGFEVFIKKADNVNNSKDRLLASSVLQELANVYPSKMELKQRKVGVYILDNANYPAILLECGYLNNPKDLAFITEKTNQEKVARSILKGLVAFANSKPTENNSSIPVETSVSDKEVSSKLTTSNTLMNQDTAILFVINGIEKGQMADYKNNLDKWVTPDEIESMNVLKGKSAIDKYGDKGKNGVIEIYTKINGSNSIIKNQVDKDDKVYEKADTLPSFPGGQREWNRYLERNLDPVIPVKNGCKSGSFTVIIQFIVDKDGSLTNLNTLTRHGYGMEDHVLNLIKKGPKWTPGIKNGELVKMYKIQPVTFVIGDGLPNHSISVSEIKEKKYMDEIVVTGLGTDNNKVIENKESEPTFPGGVYDWRRFLEKNMNTNVPVDSGAAEGSYTVMVQFLVHADGHISHLKAISDHGFGMEDEVLRVLRKSPHWIPAKQKGKKVDAYKKQPVTFVISTD